MKLRSYTDAELINATTLSKSIRQVLFKLKLKPAGGNYKTVLRTIKELGLDISHFTGKGWNKGQVFQSKQPLDLYLSNKAPIQSNKLKKRLIKDKVFTPICSSCLNSMWLGKPIPLELDHIDGNFGNNQLNNLRLLCPNCHAQTPTYRGKNIGKCLKSSLGIATTATC
jgi:hypothetical protein